MPVVIHDSNQQFCFASFANVAFIIWNEPPDLVAFNACEDRMRAMFREHPEGVGLLVVSRSRRPPPGTLAKESVAQLYRWRGSLRGLAALVEETGPLSRRVLVVLRAINALSSPKSECRLRICDTREEAARHLDEKMGVSAEEILAAIRSVCERYPAATPFSGSR